VVYSSEDLTAWFWDFLGLGPSKGYRKKYNNMSPAKQKEFRARKARRDYSPEDRRAFSKKGFVKARAHTGVNLYMNRRKESGLGTYDSNKFVVLQDEKFKGLFVANRSELDEIAGTQKKLPLARDSKGRFLKRNG
jgi:hypothetical protein